MSRRIAGPRVDIFAPRVPVSTFPRSYPVVHTFSRPVTSTFAGQLAVRLRTAALWRTAQRRCKSTNSPDEQKSLYNRLHRPNKEELLAAATGFWQRLRVRFKWFSIRSLRPFNGDDIFAFVSWIFWGHVVWFVIGTTTFVSLAIWFINTVLAQETLAGWVGEYLTKSSGLKIVFESAIVPKWKDGVITFNNVFVSRRPGGKTRRTFSKGSSTSAAAAAAEVAQLHAVDAEDDGNYTQFDVTIKTVNVTLSFAKWFNGKGLLHDVEIAGVRGVIDRTHVQPAEPDVDPKSYRHEHNTGDFEIDSFKMEDVLLNIHQPGGFRPFSVSIYHCELPRLRKQWLFYDFLSASAMTGSFDDSLFTLHPQQAHSIRSDENNVWKKHSRLRIDGLNIDHLNRGVQGPFSWIHQGNVDIVADVMIPQDGDGSIAKVMSDFYDRVEATVTGDSDANAAPDEPAADRYVVFDLSVHLNDVRATVPLFTKDLSYVNNALVRPIVAYINSRRALIPVHCRVVKRQAEFDGSWTIFDSGLMDDVSRETYDAFANDIADQRLQRKRMKLVGWWTIQLAAQALFLGLVGQAA
ncbi:putative mitochondrion biogenesis protein [Piedraia hortae CBS 480.64]|uniref:Putative mitochondrion biogenesis protein n=1 Tax=Piedraia hortae CBS 480.64 TaxID=1314780 RepID=A0A6A7CAP2_9PEZI|nr:putative mitochondrion biogenesis protein [Piedraia hortae CBS 480.64]